MRGADDQEWSLDALDGPPGVSAFDYVTGLLPPSGRGPLAEEPYSLPGEPDSGPNKLRFRGGGSWADAAAVIELLRSEPTQRGLDAVVERLADVPFRNTDELNRVTEAVLSGRPSRDRLATLARWLCRHGTRHEVVKNGIALLGVSGTETDVPLITRLALLEVFTNYALGAFQNLLPNPDRAVFDLAQQVRWWGRVDAVEQLADTTDEEIRRWLVYGGYDNGVGINYTADIAASTGELRRRLDEATADDGELLDHAGELLSELGDWDGALSVYLGLMERTAPKVHRLHHLVAIEASLSGDAAVGNALAREQHGQVEAILAWPVWVPMVREVLESDDGREVYSVIHVAERLGLETRPVVWKWLDREPSLTSWWSRLTVGASREGIERLVDEAAARLPLDELATAPAAASRNGGRELAAEIRLGLFLQGLPEFSDESWCAVRSGLLRRATRVQALRALNAWPRSQWPKGAEGRLKERLRNEPNEDIRRGIRALIDGAPLPW